MPDRIAIIIQTLGTRWRPVCGEPTVNMLRNETNPGSLRSSAHHCLFGGEDKRVMVNEDKREFMTETHDHFARTWPGLSERLAQSKLRLAPAGMTTIEIASRRRYMDVVAEVQRALEVLQHAGIRARPRVRSLEMKGLIKVLDVDAERAVDLLRAAYMRVAIRPS